MEIIARPRRRRDACYRERKVYTIRPLAPDVLKDADLVRAIVEDESRRPTSPVNARWPYRGVGPVVEISTSLDLFWSQGLAAIRMDRGWIEPAW